LKLANDPMQRPAKLAPQRSLGTIAWLNRCQLATDWDSSPAGATTGKAIIGAADKKIRQQE
jgi:hypothetical protein